MRKSIICFLTALLLLSSLPIQAQPAFDYVIKPQYEAVQHFSEELAAVFMKEKWGFVDRTGKTVIPPQFEDITGDLTEGLVGVSVE